MAAMTGTVPRAPEVMSGAAVAPRSSRMPMALKGTPEMVSQLVPPISRSP